MKNKSQNTNRARNAIQETKNNDELPEYADKPIQVPQSDQRNIQSKDKSQSNPKQSGSTVAKEEIYSNPKQDETQDLEDRLKKAEQPLKK